MKSRPLPPVDANEEIPALIERLHATERRLAELTGDEVDAVTDLEGRTFLLRRAQERLRLAEASKQAAILNALPACIALLDPQGCIVSVNEAWQQFVWGTVIQRPGYSIGLNYLEICERAWSEGTTEAVQIAQGIRSVIGGKVSHFSIEYSCHSSLEQRWFLLTATPLSGELPHGVVIMHLNITERKLAETASKQLAAIVEASTDAIIGKDLNGIISSWNKGAEKIFGYTSSEMIGTSNLRLLPVEQYEEEHQVLEKVRRSESVEHYETLRRTKDRKLITVSITLSPIKDTVGNVIGIAKVARDITEHKRTEEALEKSEERFAAAFLHASIGVTLATPEGRWLKVNRAFCELVGYSEAELLSKTYEDLTYPEDLKASRENFRRVACGEISTYELEKRYVHRNGNVVTALLKASLVSDRHGQSRYVVSQIQDITGRRKAEVDLKTLAERTERRERMLSTALSSMSDFAQIYDREGRLLFANQPLLDLWGCTLESVVGKNFFDLGYPEGLAARMQNQLEEVFESKQRITDETPYINPTGPRGHYEYIFSPICSSDGKVDCVVGSTRDVTERKQGEETLRASQANLAEAQRIAHFGSWEMDLTSTASMDTNSLRWSDEMFRIAGFEPGAVEVSNELFFSLVPPEDHAPIRQAVATAIRERQTYSVIHRLVRPSGEVRIVNETAQVFFDQKTDQPWKIVGTAHDITEKRKTEDDLARSEREQRLLARQLELERARLIEAQAVAKVGSWEMNWSTFAVIWSEETYLVFEILRENFQHTYESFLQLVHPDDRAAVNQVYLQSLGQEGTHSIEHRVLVSDDRIKFVEERWQIIFNDQGKPVRVHGTCQDITARKLATEALRVSEKRFKSLFEQAAVGVAQGDIVTGRFIQINQRFCQILGRSHEEMEEQTFSNITHLDDVSHGSEMMRGLKEGKVREFTQEKRYLKKDGAEVWADVTVSAMWAPGETPDFFLAVGQDISERKRLEDQFRQAQKMEAIGTLAGGMAHDFNNILTAIIGYTQLSCSMLSDQPEAQKNLNAVLQAAERATLLVRQILTFSRQQKLERRPIQLLPVVSESLMLLRSTIPSTIEFQTSLTGNVPMVLADSTQIHQILMNLGTNAWHAMKDGTGQLKVSLERWVVDAAHASSQSRLRPGVYARISVSDTGIGMDQGTQRRIFEPFFTTKPAGEGTGLGLAVVHGIMDSHEGAITVYSHLGEGTVFHLYFPAHAGEEALATPEDQSVPQGQGERILFVDDEELLVLLGRHALSSLGYEIETTTQPDEALARVRADPQRFALVITDQTMPRMTGVALANELHQIQPGLPIILTTGYSPSLASAAVRAAGFRQVLLKPFTLQLLAKAVHNALHPLPPTKPVDAPPSPA